MASLTQHFPRDSLEIYLFFFGNETFGKMLNEFAMLKVIIIIIITLFTLVLRY